MNALLRLSLQQAASIAEASTGNALVHVIINDSTGEAAELLESLGGERLADGCVRVIRDCVSVTARQREPLHVVKGSAA